MIRDFTPMHASWLGQVNPTFFNVLESEQFSSLPGTPLRTEYPNP
jgi:hypothetical protein